MAVKNGFIVFGASKAGRWSSPGWVFRLTGYLAIWNPNRKPAMWNSPRFMTRINCRGKKTSLVLPGHTWRGWDWMKPKMNSRCLPGEFMAKNYPLRMVPRWDWSFHGNMVLRASNPSSLSSWWLNNPRLFGILPRHRNTASTPTWTQMSTTLVGRKPMKRGLAKTAPVPP